MILQAATTGSFDFTNVGPMYYTRLRLILDELQRLNMAQVAAQSALHCVISTVGADKDSGSENYKRLQTNRNLFKRMLHIPVNEEDEKSVEERLIAEWRRLYGNKTKEDEE